MEIQVKILYFCLSAGRVLIIIFYHISYTYFPTSQLQAVIDDSVTNKSKFRIFNTNL